MDMRKLIRILLVLLCPFFVFAQKRSLDYYVREGVQNSPLRKDLFNQVRSNKIDSLKIVAGQKVRVDGNGLATFAPSYKGWGYDYAVSNGGVFSTLVSASKPVFNNPVLQNQFQNLQIQNGSIDVSVRLNDADLKYNIAGQYLSVYSDYNLTTFQETLLTELRKQAGVLLELTKRGIYNEVDYLIFNNSILAQEINLRQARLQWRNDLYALNLLCGITDTSLIVPEKPELSPAAAPFDAAASLFLEQFKFDSLKILNSRRSVDLNYRPKVNLFADAGYLSSFQLDAYKNFGVSAGVNLTVPLYDGHQRGLEYQKFEIAEATRSTYKSFAAHQYTAEIAQLENQIRESEALIADIDRQMTSAAQLLDLLHLQLNRGSVHMPDLLLATQNWIALKSSRLQAEAARLQLMNRLKYRKQ
jgi:hypothetical protein